MPYRQRRGRFVLWRGPGRSSSPGCPFSRRQLQMSTELCPRELVSVYFEQFELKIHAQAKTYSTLSPTSAQNSALFPCAASTSVSPACSAASSSSFLNPSSVFSLSSTSLSYSFSSHGKVKSEGALLGASRADTVEGLLLGP